jgi:YidC/Oxa1 family membrane protein insertase
MGNIFHEFLYRPLLNLLFIIYNSTIADIGIAIIILTLIIRLILLPLFYKSAKDQTIIQKITPRIKELQKLHKDNKEKQVQEIMKVYKEHKVNPFSGFLLLLIQLPILIALYQVFLKGFSKEVLSGLYSFVSAPAVVHTMFLGFIDLMQKNIWLVILAGGLQFLQSKLLLNVNKKPEGQAKEMDMTQRLAKNMAVMGPLLTVVILYPLPSVVALYWLTTSAFSVIQQLVINKKIAENERNKNIPGTTN